MGGLIQLKNRNLVPKQAPKDVQTRQNQDCLLIESIKLDISGYHFPALLFKGRSAGKPLDRQAIGEWKGRGWAI
jgi:hypothetical protein